MTQEKGFTLVEMAIGMVIVGILIAFATIAFSGLLRSGFERKTFADMEVIADAIAIYAQKHMRVPCPADPAGGSVPFGFERNPSGDVSIFGTCATIANAEGIIPYATLGLPQRAARDRFGNFITYRVSLTSAQTPANSITRPINNWCMAEPFWYKDTDNNQIADTYVSLTKAAFCCGTWMPGNTATIGGTAGDIDIQGSFGPLADISRTFDATGAAANGFGAHINEYRSSAIIPPTRAELINPTILGFGGSTVPPIFPAYVLVSHGQNGFGAFLGNGTANQKTGGTAQELENADNDVTYFAPDRNASLVTGAGETSLFRPNLDDILFWETPAQILGRIGDVSCSHP